MNLLVGASIFVILTIAGIILSVMISLLTCKKSSFADSTPEGFSWALPIFFVYFLLNARFGEDGYPASFVLPIFSDPMKSLATDSDLIGKIYAMLLITCVATTRLFHTTDVAICVQTKDEAKAFEEALAKDLKKKESATK